MTTPVAGAHYPRSTGEFLSWFATDDDCLDYLEWLRWPGGFVCPDCGHAGGWRLGDGRVKCGGCGSRTSVTAGTIFDQTRTPLTVWFHACWLFATAKDGVSAQHLQRVLEISSYQTAWAMLHRLRSALVRPGRDRLSGTVEVDETYIGGEEPGLRGGRQRGKKVLTGIAVEVREPKGIGRCRMAPLDDASGDTLGTFVTENVQPGATVITDGWAAYRAISGKGYQHRPINQKRPAPLGMTRTACCPESIGSPRCASGGCWAPTRARLTPRTCPPISTSSSSGSTAAALPAGAWCSTGSCSWPPATSQSGTWICSPAKNHAVRSGPGAARDTLRASSAQRRTAHGGPPKSSCSSSPVKWIPQSGRRRSGSA